MAVGVEKVNGIAFADIEKINGKTDANIEAINGAGFEAASYGPPEVDATSVATYTTTSGSMTCAHTTTSTAGRGLLVGVYERYDGNLPFPPDDPTGVTYDSVAMTKLVSQSKSECRLTVWSLIAPNAGTANIVATQANASDGASAIRAITFTGVSQGVVRAGSSFHAQYSDSFNAATSISRTLSGGDVDDANQYFIDFIMWDGTGSSAQEEGALQTEFPSAPTSDASASYEEVGGDDSITMSWSWTTSTAGVHITLKTTSDTYS